MENKILFPPLPLYIFLDFEASLNKKNNNPVVKNMIITKKAMKEQKTLLVPLGQTSNLKHAVFKWWVINGLETIKNLYPVGSSDIWKATIKIYIGDIFTNIYN